MLAAQMGDVPIVKLLLERGAIVDIAEKARGHPHKGALAVPSGGSALEGLPPARLKRWRNTARRHPARLIRAHDSAHCRKGARRS